MKLEKFKEWVKANKAIIISVCVGVVICAGAIIGSKIIINNHNKLVAEETTTESTTVNMDAYKITTEPETETTVIEKGDRTIIKDSDGNETVNRQWQEGVTQKTNANANGGGGQIKTSNGAYNGEQSTSKAQAPKPKSDVFGDVNGDGKTGCKGEAWTLSEQEKAEVANDKFYM
ncbi:MAG: hypothetical protein K5917_07705 [Clostridiales bacterium]|nr:hypothetical protein [Clostridiales bacterium]